MREETNRNTFVSLDGDCPRHSAHAAVRVVGRTPSMAVSFPERRRVCCGRKAAALKRSVSGFPLCCVGGRPVGTSARLGGLAPAMLGRPPLKFGPRTPGAIAEK